MCALRSLVVHNNIHAYTFEVRKMKGSGEWKKKKYEWTIQRAYRVGILSTVVAVDEIRSSMNIFIDQAMDCMERIVLASRRALNCVYIKIIVFSSVSSSQCPAWCPVRYPGEMFQAVSFELSSHCMLQIERIFTAHSNLLYGNPIPMVFVLSSST